MIKPIQFHVLSVSVLRDSFFIALFSKLNSYMYDTMFNGIYMNTEGTKLRQPINCELMI